jgi:hypothetical protein
MEIPMTVMAIEAATTATTTAEFIFILTELLLQSNRLKMAFVGSFIPCLQ